MSDKYVAYVGTYTHEKSRGIHIYDMDVEKGLITERKEVEIDNPSYITLSHDGKYLYSICDAGVSAFRVMPDGDIELINVKSINGMRGCHLSVTKDNTFIFVSGYHDGKLTVMHLNEDGSVGTIADEVFHKGIGSIAERNFRPHISNATLTPDEKLLCVCDLGIDQIKVYEFDKKTGRLDLYDIIRTQLESAPREILFSADGRFAYVMCELKNYIDVYKCSVGEDGRRTFEFIQNIFTLRRDHRVNSAATDIMLTKDGEHLLCSNAGDNSVTIYKIDKDNGTLSILSSLPISGDYPKYINLFPDERHLMSMNHDGNSITFFTVHWDKGLIVMSGREVRISKPNNMVIRKL